MRRRDFITLLSGAGVMWPLTARAQNAVKPYRVALVFGTSPVSEMAGPDPIHPSARIFVHALRDLGYVEGKNLILERRSAEGKFERFPELIRELVSINVDVIVTVTDPITQAAKEVTRTVPIVALMGDPIGEGLIQSLARPRGNITGLAVVTGPENFAKRVQLLKELLPRMSRVAFLQTKAENATWLPLPLTRSMPSAGVYPVAALGPVMAAAANAFQAKTQAPLDICANAVLAVAGLAAQAHADVVLPTGEAKPLSLFLVTVAPSGERKTSTDSLALVPVRERVTNLRQEHELACSDHENAHAAWDAERKMILANKKLDLPIRKVALDGKGLEVYATGIRQIVGMDWHPRLRQLYFSENARDWLSEDLPEDKLNRVTQPGKDNFGYPYCHQGNFTILNSVGDIPAANSLSQLRCSGPIRPPSGLSSIPATRLATNTVTGNE